MFATAPFRQVSQHLRHATWLDQIKQAYLLFIGLGFLMSFMPHAAKAVLRPLFLVAPLLPLIAKDLAHLPDAIARVKPVLAARKWRSVPVALLHPEQLGLLRLDRALRRGFMSWLLRRPQPPGQAGQTFGYLQQGAYGTACACVLLSCLVELPLDASVVPLLVADESTRILVHLLMFGGAASTIVYLMGDRWLVGAGCHVLAGDTLSLRIGARTHGDIPLAAIAGCERLAEPADTWLQRKGVAPRQALTVSPLAFDKPNAVLVLHPDSPVRITHLGVERNGISCIFVYVDRPDEFLATLVEAGGMRWRQ